MAKINSILLLLENIKRLSISGYMVLEIHEEARIFQLSLKVNYELIVKNMFLILQ